MTIVDDEELGGAMTEKLDERLDETATPERVALHRGASSVQQAARGLLHCYIPIVFTH